MVNQVIEIVLYVLAGLLALPCAVLLVQCLFSLLPVRRCREAEAIERPSVGVLMPAHNEEGVIGETIRVVMNQLEAGDRLLVVADNCSDGTAEVARRSGAEVVERFDHVKRGKGYALAFGREYLADDPPDVLMVIDADCHPDVGMVETVGRLAMVRGRAVQSVYEMEVPADPGVKDLVSGLAFTVRNRMRNGGLAWLGLPCILGGTGMAWPFGLVDGKRLATGDIVEDMRLGLDLALEGSAPMFCPYAKVTGYLPGEAEAKKTQRTRWEHGYLETMLRQAPKLFGHGLVRGNIGLIGLGFELMIPPLSLLVMGLTAGVGLTLAGGLSGLTGFGPAVVTGSAFLAVMVSVFLGWFKFARHRLPFGALAAAPIYLAWKAPIYLAFLFKREKSWVRTKRDVETAEDWDEFEDENAGVGGGSCRDEPDTRKWKKVEETEDVSVGV